MIEGYAGEWNAAQNGCSGWTVARHGAQGVSGAVGTIGIAAGGAGMVSKLAGAGSAAAGSAPASSGALTEYQIGSTVEGVLDDATVTTVSKAVQYSKAGGFTQANADFDALTQGAQVVNRGNGLRTATLNNGTQVNVRPFSSAKAPTLEINTPGAMTIKVRY